MLKICLAMNRYIPILIIVGVIFVGVFGVSYAQESNNIPSYNIPNWFKSTASWWVEGQITDDEFGEALTDLIDNEIIVIEGYGKIDILEEQIENIMELTVSTDKKLYIDGETIHISGITDSQSKVIVTVIDHIIIS